ncbi:MAG: cytochrome c [Gemmatimonadota bacterium]
MTRKVMLALVALALGGCNWWYNEVPSPDDLMHRVPWFDHMILSKAVHPYQRFDMPRNTPPGVVPMGGGERDWRVGDPSAAFPVYGFDILVANALTHPSTPAGVGARSGEELFDTYCAMCHGFQGAADGTVTPYNGAPSLLTPNARHWSDGYLYSIVRYGRAGMPQYGDKIVRPDERWAVVDYVRSLQAKSPLPPAAGGAP